MFLFISPLGLRCFNVEKQIIEIKNKLDLDICFNYIPMVKEESLKQDLMQRNWVFNSSVCLSQYRNASYDALNLYHAIKLTYGNKRARRFLFDLQRELSNGSQPYSAALATKVLEQMNLSRDSVFKSTNCSYLRDSIMQDQKLAQKYQITTAPSVVIYNEDKIDDFGILLEGNIDYDELLDAIAPQNNSSINHLRLI